MLELNRQVGLFYQPEIIAVPPVAFVEQSAACALLYKQFIVSQFNFTDFNRFKNVVLDCANGAASKIAPVIFEQLGIHVTLINASPDGFNINDHAGSTYPQVLSQKVLQSGADIGFAFDGDADRVIAVSKSGTIKDGDDILAVLSCTADFVANHKIVGTVMSNSGLAHWLKLQGKELLRSDVGESNVCTLMQQTGSVLGGEPSGHILTAKSLHCSDGIFVALQTLKALQTQNNLTFQTFAKFFSGAGSIQVTTQYPLSSQEILQLHQEASAQLGAGRIFLRYSQTEPILRILVECSEPALGQQVLHKLTVKLKNLLL
jgi:phosphoglucosamine mutase